MQNPPALPADTGDSLLRADSVPLYTQLKQRLLSEIRDGRYAEGGLLPTEAQLCDLYGVSRITVRRAVSELQDEGVLEKRHGKGTFVSVQRLESSLVRLDGFSETYSAIGVEHHSEILGIEEGPADAATAAALRLPAGGPVLSVRRLISTRRGPLTLDQSSFDPVRFPGLADLLHDDVSIYRLLRTHYGAAVEHAQRRINVRLAGQAERQVLACNPGEPLFDMEKIVFDAAMQPLQRSILLTPCNRITLTIRV
jgi:GntR family transcriptional regulator, frlABCD operon transcriptional regulator